MAFNDDPIVDPYSKASEESVLQTKLLFSQRNNFISREEYPDFGVDLNIELISNNRATGKRFPIQIKSSEDFSIVTKKDKRFVSYSIKTSRIGYLCRIPPSYGLIILYDDKNKIGYYDYVENIVIRLSEEKNNEEWKKQENVNVNIPVENILNNDTINLIYKKIINRFINTDILLKVYGSRFGIPYFATNENKPLLNKIEDVISILEDYGIFLFNNYDYDILIKLLSNISLSEKLNSSKLSLLGSLVYYSSGKNIEAKLFTDKSLKFFSDELSENNKEILNIIDLSIDFKLGNINKSDFSKKLIKLKTNIKSQMNILYMDILLINLEISFCDEGKCNYNEILKKAYDQLKVIENLDLSSKNNHMLNITISSYIYEIGIKIYRQNITILEMRGRMNLPTPLNIRAGMFKEFISIYQDAKRNLYKTYEFSIREKDELLEAFALKELTFQFFDYAFCTTVLEVVNTLKSDEEKQMYRFFYQLSIKAYNFLIQKNFIGDAFQALVTTLNIINLYDNKFQEEISPYNKTDLLKILSQLEKETNYKFVDEVNNYFKQKKELHDTLDEAEDYKNISDEEIERFAVKIRESLFLPENRTINIISDVKSLRYFFSNRICKALVLQQDLTHTYKAETYYKNQVEYILYCKTRNFHIEKNINYELILSDFQRNYCSSCPSLMRIE